MVDAPPGPSPLIAKWVSTSASPALRGALIAGAILAYALLVWLGHQLRQQQGDLTVLWPASGLLFLLLWMTPTRWWPGIVAVQIAIEVGFNRWSGEPFALWQVALFGGADALEGMIGATLARRWVPAPDTVRLKQVLRSFGAVAIGAAVSATLGAAVIATASPGRSYAEQWQIWWAGNLLGALVIASVAFTWLMRFAYPSRVVRVRSWIELALLGGLGLALTVAVFLYPSENVRFLLQLPAALLAVLVVAAFRLPARWAMLLATLVALTGVWLACHGYGPFRADPARVASVAELQWFAASLVAFTFIVGTAVREQHETLQQLRTSNERYQNFLAHSSEAIWRVELSEPMPLDLPLPDQLAWLERTAIVAECNLAYRRLSAPGSAPGATGVNLHAAVPWRALTSEQLARAAASHYQLDGLRLDFEIDGKPANFLAALAGVVENGRLRRIWGVARDVTELLALNHRLSREQERLRAYAQQLIGAEEKARRTIAVDLHDGIGQTLVGLGMSLDVAMSQAAGDQRSLLQEMRQMLRSVHEATRRVISDLSPPGLYELGIGPALQWLAVKTRSTDKLQVDLQVDVREADVSLEMRVLVFRLVRELLRNVIKHARVDRALVRVSRHGPHLKLEVIDQGQGFEYQMDLFRDAGSGFGLWSIADRVTAAKGRVDVATSPGAGCHVTIELPLTTAADDPPIALRA